MPIPIKDLLSGYATYRYDDEGNPLYTPAEKILLALRWHDWATAERLSEALDIDEMGKDERNKYSAALARLVRLGHVEARGHARTLEREYRIAPVRPKWKEPPPEPEYDENGVAIPARRGRPPSGEQASASLRKARIRRERREAGLCIGCGAQRQNPEFVSCDMCRARARHYAQERHAATGRWNKPFKQYGIVPENKCRRCHSEALPNFVLCAYHLEWQRKRANNPRVIEKKRKSARETWRRSNAAKKAA